MRQLARLAARLYNTPLLTTPEKADVFDGVYRAALEQRWQTVEPEPLAQELMVAGGPAFVRTRGGYLRSDTGIALIQVLGPLVQRAASGIDAMSGGFESYQAIGAQLSAAVADPLVRGILLEFDSPGGEASGVSELADAVRAADAQKPVVAHANEMAFSAAYWLASAAGELYVPKSGMVGSVGVIMLHVDQSQMNAKRGINVTHIQAGARKADFSPHAPLSDEALSGAQAMVDRLYGQFTSDVAKNRGIDEQAVRATEAGLLNPDQAMTAGMVDGVGTLSDAMARLSALMRDPTQRKGYGQRAAASADFPQEHDMSKDAASTAAPEANAAHAEQLAKTRTEALAEGATKGEAEGYAKGIAAERARIGAILAHAEATERRAFADHLAFKTSSTVDECVVLLAATPKQTAAAPTNALAAAMARNPNAAIGAAVDAAAPKATVVDTDDIYAKRRASVHAVK